MQISVLVPTFRRPDDLGRCLLALGRQVRRAARVIVVARAGDNSTHAAITESEQLGLPLVKVIVDQPGWAHALTAGLKHVETEIVAITDDDAAAKPDWLLRILQVFERDALVGGVGGRDIIGGDSPATDRGQLREIVGKVRWYGKVVGNHHLGCGPARTVDVLKGVNSAYRTDVLREVGFDPALRGHGAQVHLELDVGLAIIRRGWKLIYDPAIQVDHFPAPRHDRDQRTGFNHDAQSDQVHNETLALLRHLSLPRQAAFGVWSVLSGTRTYPGIACWLFGLITGSPDATPRLLATLHGRWLGLLSRLRPTTRPASV